MGKSGNFYDYYSISSSFLLLLLSLLIFGLLRLFGYGVSYIVYCYSILVIYSCSFILSLSLYIVLLLLVVLVQLLLLYSAIIFFVFISHSLTAFIRFGA